MGRYVKYILLATFLAVVLLIVFLQYNSARNIDLLITGNEKLLGELDVKNQLQELQTGVASLESKVRGAVISGNVGDTALVVQEMDSLKATLGKLKPLESDSMILPLLGSLNRLVYEKINFNKTVLQQYAAEGKLKAEQLINTKRGLHLSDSLKTVAQQIDGLHQLAVTKLITQADSNGRKARTLGIILAIIAAVIASFTFGYVAYKVRQQQQLIRQLDASEKKAIEAAQVKDNFLANMSHEIRTPMNAILGYTNLLQRQGLGGHAKEYVQTIQKSGENLLTLINDILDISKIEAGMMRIESAPFSIRGLVHSVAAMFGEKAREKQIAFRATIEDTVPDMLEGDATRLTQILINLIGNAIKFTDKGSVAIDITNQSMSDATIQLGITVTDTGIGIASEKLNKIFNRFQQAEDSVTRKFGGSGLGLAIVSELVSLQKGTIHAISELGKGASFQLVIPYQIATEHPAAPVMVNDYHAAPGVFEQAKVLVVEDNEINQNLIRHLFAEWRLSFDMVGNGSEALTALTKTTYDLILMDMQMPEMDGYTAAQQIRGHLQLDTPIIAMTAHALAGEREKCMSYGMNDYIAKPIREAQLHQLISQFTKLSAQQAPPQPEIAVNGQYQYINLSYMKEVSAGNKAYEKTVTGQFIEAIPTDLATLQDYWNKQDIVSLRQLAHNMKTTVSVMGLNELLQPHLDALEYETLNSEVFNNQFNQLTALCEAALAEARQFYAII